jgi:4-aminobutyrate aminotransferase-like enzyme/Ser/Thr protein kinase RdoA (MazF antagonist)
MPAEPLAFLNRQQPAFTLNEAAALADQYYGLAGAFEPLLSERDQNFRVTTPAGERFVFKISNARDEPGVVDMQVQALAYLAAQDPSLPLPRTLPARSGALIETHTTPAGARHPLRLVTYLPGTLLADAAHTPALRRNLGALLARLDLAFRGFFHPAARQNHPWDLTRCAALRPQTEYIPNPETRRNVAAILDRMAETVLPALRGMRWQVIHQDAHTHNVLVPPANPDQIAGLIDFGDMIFAPLICELAVAGSSCLGDDLSGDPVSILAEVAAGYDRLLPLEPAEVDVLYDLVLARLAQNITITEMRKALYPDDAPHADLADGFMAEQAALIVRLLDVGRARVADGIRRACHFPPYFPAAAAGLPARRVQRLGAHAPHFYRQPLHLERGQGVWLYGADGRRYLDCYNNIPVAGHCHPRVVRAIERQAGALNTHTRYLYRAVLDYTDRLTAALPPHLSACILVNSGSEANDVALQLAQFATGRRGALIMEDAYHGITQAVMHLSPEHFARPLPAHVMGLLTPDGFAGPLRGAPDPLAAALADADRALAELDARGFGTAAWMVDAALSSSGIPHPPEGYFAAVAERVRAAGGLVIADEVQAGFGRLGEMWGHGLRGMRADIVTLGKPVGNGYPLGVVVTSPDILDAFVAHTGLFSTFGGNPVACAAGSAVLDVIEEEGLVANAREVGAYFRAQLRALMLTQPLIGDVRGEGLMIGVELVTDRESRAPAAAVMPPLLERMREAGVLAGSTGRHGNVLKIRPPLVFGREHVEQFVEALGECLS